MPHARRKPPIAQIAALCAFFATNSAPLAHAQERLRYSVDMTVPATRAFTVTLQVDSLSRENDVFEFAATAPGTYQVMDIGRFVRAFEALDANGDEVATTRIATNRWRFSAPERVRTIRYRVRATRDTTVSEHPIYAMCGSLLRDDYAQINGQTVFGFPSGMQREPIAVRLQYPASWQVGTALPLRDGAYRADNYDQLGVITAGVQLRRMICSKSPRAE